MKKLLFFLLLMPLCTFAQQEEIVHIDSLPKAGVLLDKGWKWQASDGSWLAINPTKDIQDSIPFIFKQKVGTMRLYLSLNQRLKNVTTVLQIQQSVAGQYFLNGRKIAEFGVVSSDREQVLAKDPYWSPVFLQLRTDTINALEVRFAVQPHIHYTSVFETSNPLSSIRLYEANDGISYYTSTLTRFHNFEFLLFGISFMIFIIHFVLYLLQKEVVANLYFALSRLVYAFGSLTQIAYWFYTPSVEYKYWIGCGTFVLFIFSTVLTMVSVIFYLKRKMDFLDKMLLILFFPAIAFVFLVYPHGWQVGALFQLTIIFNLLRVAISNLRRNKTDSLIIGSGAFTTVIFFVLFVIGGTFYNNNFTESLDLSRMTNYTIAALALPIVISVFLARNFSNTAANLKLQLIKNEALAKEKQLILSTQNETLEHQVAERTAELKASQAQLIQSEKLASLGELTAGIAHEIQNPLNFVNNFAEVSAEMLDEMHEELEKGDTTEAIAIATDLKTNLEKINHHGQRASSIVKGMLEHSRVSTGVKEPTDLNTLADEYLRLAYHGLRAKDSGFNCQIETHFEPDLPRVDVIPQDIGRVLLNLINNAFYAVHHRDVETLHATSLQAYQPTVTVTTQKTADHIIIKIQDNGNGIPEDIRDKIFQPFFTTKPTGQGTGLGLSLAYDIVTKGHGGTLDVESKEEHSTIFTLKIPI